MNTVDTLITDLQKPFGEKLIDADAMNNSNYYRARVNRIDELSFLIYMEQIKNEYILGD
jgi:hypothetical protein